MNDKKPNPDVVRLDFYRLALDWVHLHTYLPKPVAQENGRRSTYREYGHPAQWASDKAAQIADVFSTWHEIITAERSETPAPPRTSSEQVRVVKAWKYLEPRFDHLVTVVVQDDLKEVTEIHRQVRNGLGQNNPRTVLPIPCPGQECGLRTLTRTVAVGKDYIVCGSCGYTVSDTYYPLLVRIAFDTLIESM